MGKGGKVAFKILQRMLMLLLVFLLLCNIYVIMAKKITGSMTARCIWLFHGCGGFRQYGACLVRE